MYVFSFLNFEIEDPNIQIDADKKKTSNQHFCFHIQQIDMPSDCM